VVWLALILMVMPLLPARAVMAEGAGESESFPVESLRFMQPFKNSLSSSSWVIAQGLDPRLASISTERSPETGLDPQLAAGGGRSASAGGLNQQVPFRNPAPSFSRNLIITRQLGLFPIQTEPSIAVDPTDPNHLVMGTIDYNFSSSISAYVSFDAGETWDGPHPIPHFREDLTGGGDPIIAFDQEGNVYFAFISIGVEEFQIGSLVSEAEVSSMAVAKSADGGITWDEPVSASRSTTSSISQVDQQGKERGIVTTSFLDKPWMAVGPNPHNPNGESVYLTYTNFETSYSVIYADEVPFLTSPATKTTIKVVRSDDGGVTWTQPLSVSPTVLQAAGASEPGEGEGANRGEGAVDPERFLGIKRASDATTEAASTDAETQTEGNETQEPQQTAVENESERTVQGSQPKVMSDGTVVITYLDTTNDGIQKGLATIMVVISHDGGKSYSKPVQAGVMREIQFSPRIASFRYWGSAFPQLAVGPGKQIYILTTGAPVNKLTDDGDILLFRSLDEGKTWEEPVTLNQDQSTGLQFFPSIAVSADGVVHAMWGDMRDDPSQVRYNIYYSKSQDEGKTWGFTVPEQNFTAPDTRVTDFASNSLKGFPGGQFIGDYFSIAATKENVFMVWTDTRLGEFGGPNEQIGFARQTALKAPSLFLSPPQGPAGRTIDIQGFNFQPQSNILLEVGGNLASANLRTDDKGQFQTSIFMPVTGEGASNIQALDETGNQAVASFYTVFGFDTIQKSLDQINQHLGIETPTPSVAPAGTPGATPGATPAVIEAPGAATPGASGAAPLAVSSNAGKEYGGLAALGLLAGAIAAGAVWKSRLSR
jgi:hypothetical protein